MSGLQITSLLTVKCCKSGFERQLVSCCRVLTQQTNLSENGDTFPVTGVPLPTRLLAVCKACVIGHGDKGQKYFWMQHFPADLRIVLQSNMTSLANSALACFLLLENSLFFKKEQYLSRTTNPYCLLSGVLSCGKKRPQLS